jgi:predicted component of type VI protein secretion system
MNAPANGEPRPENTRRSQRYRQRREDARSWRIYLDLEREAARDDDEGGER